MGLIWRCIGHPRFWQVFLAFLVAASISATCGVVGITYYIWFYQGDMPNLQPFLEFEPPRTGVITSSDGKVLIELAKEYRTVILYKDIPPIMRQAVLSAEDKNFFSHGGVDWRVFPRVFFKTMTYSFVATNRASDLRHGFHPIIILPQGGSSITQQLVRGYFLQDMTQKERTNFDKLFRKCKEIRVALWLEGTLESHFHSKEKAKEAILERYASFIYVSNGRYGFAAGSEYYFNRPLSTLTQDDADLAASLAGITKSPFEYAPTTLTDRPTIRRNSILNLMVANRYLTEAQADQFKNRPLRTVSRGPKTNAPAIVDHIFEELRHSNVNALTIDNFFMGKIKIYSTADSRIQQIANQALEHGITSYEKDHPQAQGLTQGSVIVLRNQDGAVLAEVGSREIYKGKHAAYMDYNRAIDALRQPGSAFKPLVYLTALMNGYTLETQVMDAPISVTMGWHKPRKWIANYDKKFKGSIPLRQALAESRNAATMWITKQIGIQEVLATAKQLGITTHLEPYPTTALGASEVKLVELANIYRALASGIQSHATPVQKIAASNGDIIFARSSRTESVAIDQPQLIMIQEGLRGVIRIPGATAHSLDNADFPFPIMGKTGTTTAFKDALFIGSTYGPKGITVAVRIGFDNPGRGYDDQGKFGIGPGRGLGPKQTGGKTALPVFKEIVRNVYDKKLVGSVPRFPQEIEDRIDLYLGKKDMIENDK